MDRIRDLRELGQSRPEERYAASLLKASDEDRFLLCVVYSPNRMPLRGADKRTDVASPRVLEKAAWRFMLNGARTGVDHQSGGEDACRVVENWVHRGPPWTVTSPAGVRETVKAGDWLVGLILSPKAWADYKAGRFGGVSMQGTATRRPPSKQTLKRLEK